VDTKYVPTLHYHDAADSAISTLWQLHCHVSGSVLWFLIRYKYTINTRAKTNKIALRQFTANQSTCRHLHYLTHRHTFRHGVSGSTVTVTEDKTMCVLAKLIGSTGNVRILSRKIEFLCQDTRKSVSDPVILCVSELWVSVICYTYIHAEDRTAWCIFNIMFGPARRSETRL